MRPRATAAPLLLSWTLLVFPSPLTAAPAAAPKPSRKPLKGCKWEKLTDAAAGLEVWAQRCDFGFRKIDFLFEKNALLIRYSDGGKPDPVIELLDLKDGEAVEAGIQRLFSERTSRFLVSRCRLVPSAGKPPAGSKWFTFEPEPAYAAELRKKQDPNEVPPPPCGDWGSATDGVQYWEAQPASGARKVLFVRVGQETPLYDERTLRLLPAAPARTAPPAR
ncbi:MAG TPA: hypothetical protein PLB01_06600 [Thermoanaerobaculia bacterium]|nr:hypothetical protein [Thermoanaerobaculia bacterium]